MRTIMVFILNHMFEIMTILGVMVLAYQQPKRKYGWVYFGVGIVMDIFLIGIWSVFDATWEKNFVWQISRYLGQFIVILGIVYVWLDCRILSAVFVATMGYCIQHLSSRLNGAFQCILSPHSPIWSHYFVMYILVGVIYGGVYWVMNRKYHFTRDGIQIANPMQLIISTLTMTVMIFLEEVSYPMILVTTNSAIRAANYLSSAVFALMILILEMNVLKKNDLEQELAVTRRILDEERSQYELEKGVVDVINLKCHDLKHQLRTIGREMPSSEKEQIERAVKQYDSRVKTGNRALDVVLTMKRMVCEGSNIEFTCFVDGSLLSFIEEPDIYSLFGNLLDNAIEEVREFEEEYRVINLNVCQQQQFVLITEENYIHEMPLIVEGLPQTTKGDRNYHGFGIRSMQMIAEKYNGHVKVMIEKGVFRLDIMLAIPKAQREN